MKKTKLLGSGLCFIAATVAAAYFMTVRKTPDPAKQQPVEIVKFVASKDFSKLPEKERADYWEKVSGKMEETRQGGPPFMEEIRELPKEERKAFFKNVRPMFHARVLKEASEYFALPDEKKTEYIDNLIDKFEERRNDQPPPPPPDGEDGKDGPPRGPPSAAQIKEHIETTPPAARAKMDEFFKEMHARMKERGIQPPGPPPPR